MKNLKHLPSMLSIVFVVTCFNVLILGQTIEKNQIASISGLGAGVRFDVSAPHSAATLTVIAPDGQSFSKEFQAGSSPEFKLSDEKGERLPDGQYIYELRLTPIFAAGVKEELKAARGKANEAAVIRELRKRGALPHAPVQSGSFLISNGSLVLPGATEERGRVAQAAAIETPAAPVAPSSGRTGLKIQRHHPRFFVFDQVIPDDLIVQGSICTGFDCVNNENFATDTIRMKETTRASSLTTRVPPQVLQPTTGR